MHVLWIIWGWTSDITSRINNVKKNTPWQRKRGLLFFRSVAFKQISPQIFLAVFYRPKLFKCDHTSKQVFHVEHETELWNTQLGLHVDIRNTASQVCHAIRHTLRSPIETHAMETLLHIFKLITTMMVVVVVMMMMIPQCIYRSTTQTTASACSELPAVPDTHTLLTNTHL